MDILPVTAGCIILLLVIFGMNWMIADATNKLGLVTANTLVADTQVWNLFTSQFYELHAIKLTLDLVGIVTITTKTKIVGGFDQFGIYFGLCLFACSFFTSAYCFIRYFSTALEEMIMVPIYGFSGVFMIMVTYSRQQLRYEPIIPQLPHVTYNNLPVLVILAQLLLWLVGLRWLALDLPFSIIATLVSWSYLRFFYRFDSGTAILGDRSDDFSFVNMFPETLHLVVIPMTTAFYNIFAMIGLFPELEQQVERFKIQHHLRSHVEDPLSPLNAPRTDVIQERRRAKAMKLLDAKMAELSTTTDGGWDDKEDERPIELSSVRV